MASLEYELASIKTTRFGELVSLKQSHLLDMHNKLDKLVSTHQNDKANLEQVLEDIWKQFLRN